MTNPYEPPGSEPPKHPDIKWPNVLPRSRLDPAVLLALALGQFPVFLVAFVLGWIIALINTLLAEVGPG